MLFCSLFLCFNVMRYYFESTDQNGKVTTGTYEADTEAEVSEHLQKRQLIPVLIRQETEAFLKRDFALFERITPMDRIALVRNLAATTKAGLSILESLDILAKDATKPLLRKVLLQIKSNIQNGQALWQSFQYYQRYFPPFFVGMVRAAESSGKLDTTLTELAQYLTREYSLVKRVKSAMAYPMILLAASVGVTFVLLGFVMPAMEKTFERSHIVLPFYTKIMLAIGHGVAYNFFLDIFAAAVIVILVIAARRNLLLKTFFSRLLFHIPIVKELIKKIVLVKFARTLGSLLSSGALINESLRLAADAVGNEYYKAAMLKVSADVSRGVSLSKAMAVHDRLFPNFLISLVIVGEKTGTLENILKTFAEFYDEEVDYSLRALTTFLEPALLLVMGLIIGSIVFSILIPIYQFVGKFI
jgi:type IV pilus assembly protein PilC